jgi:hypothetical protein
MFPPKTSEELQHSIGARLLVSSQKSPSLLIDPVRLALNRSKLVPLLASFNCNAGEGSHEALFDKIR